MNVRAVIAEWRDSLPDVLAGRDPIAFRPPEFYRARLLRYGADCAVPERPESGSSEYERQVCGLATLPVSPVHSHDPDSSNRRVSDDRSFDAGNGIEKESQGVGQVGQGNGQEGQ